MKPTLSGKNRIKGIGRDAVSVSKPMSSQQRIERIGLIGRLLKWIARGGAASGSSGTVCPT
jgi:hypothetical protein